MQKKTNLKGKAVGDWIFILPETPKGGSFDPGSSYIQETAVIVDVGPLCSDEVKKMVGKKVKYTAWACEDQTIDGQRYLYAPESSNFICRVF